MLWTRGKTTGGYGVIYFAKRQWYAHRLAFWWVYGKDPGGLQVCHACDVRNCYEPSHLFLGTNADNHADMMAKGRNNHGPVRRGETHPMAKLSESQVAEVLYMHQFGFTSARGIARAFGVHGSTIGRIIHGVRQRP